MVSTALSNDSLKDLLRSLSVKRRNGVLGLQTDEDTLEVMFLEGRIVRAQRGSESPVLGVCQRLVKGGSLAREVLSLIQNSGVSVSQLLELLVEKGLVSEEQFLRAKRGYEHDLLHELVGFAEGSAQFSPKVIRAEQKQLISIYPGQLILDFAEISQEAERFTDIFGSLETDESLVEHHSLYGSPATVGDAKGLLVHESIIIETIDLGATPREIAERSLLPKFEVMEGLLALYDQQRVQVTRDPERLRMRVAERAVEVTLENVASLSADIDELIDQAVAELQGISSDPLDRKVALDDVPLSTSTKSSDSSIFTENGESVFEKAAEAESEPSGRAQLGSQPKASGAWSQTHYSLDERQTKLVVAFCILLYLGVFAILGTNLFENWFTALRHFTLL